MPEPNRVIWWIKDEDERAAIIGLFDDLEYYTLRDMPEEVGRLKEMIQSRPGYPNFEPDDIVELRVRPPLIYSAR